MSKSELVKDIGEKEYDQFIEGKETVLIDLWAEWCGPCRSQSPIIDKIAEKFNGKVKVVKVDVDSEQALAARLGVRGIPTLVLLEKGAVKQMLVGLHNEEKLTKILSEIK